MSLTRKFSIKTTLFNLPKGSSPLDNENIKLVKRIMKSATGAESVDVSFNENINGEPLTDMYNLELEYPNMLAEGKYVSLSNLDKDKGKLLADVITALSGEGDAKSSVQKLLDSVSGEKNDSGESPEEDKEKTKSTDGEDKDVKPFTKKEEDPFSNAPKAPAGNKPPMFAKRRQANKPVPKFARASSLEKNLGIGMRDAIEIVRLVDNAPDFPSFVKSASRIIVDDNDKPMTRKEYAEIASYARGEKGFLG